MEIKTISPVFVLGCPRSGTTFLSSLLEKTQYGRPIETQFIVKYYKRLRQYGNMKDQSKVKCLISDILKERAVLQWRLNVEMASFLRKIPNVDYSTIVHYLALERFNRLGFKNWGDKTPQYLLELPIILDLFPNAKYIYIVRDGRDVALSLLKMPWGPGNVISCAKLWCTYFKHEELIKKLKNNNQLLSIKYEDLMDKPKTNIKNIYQFLGETIDLTTLDMLSSKVKHGNYDKWKSKLSKTQIINFNTIASRFLEDNGYCVSNKKVKINFFSDICASLQNRVKWVLYMLRLNIIDTIKIRFFGKEPFAE